MECHCKYFRVADCVFQTYKFSVNKAVVKKDVASVCKFNADVSNGSEYGWVDDYRTALFVHLEEAMKAR